ncbi:MAG: hypothetical protein DIZ77_09385 [endosymbiont of Seepiophila jonesi]|uniref:Uncharacterized protein n=1 Tax=endosymbiont of Lamellibrachia luymesi TaxID=2200907 RepID=A0A370DZ88_9GAMM|nr:MAG: hypothetical protein DIZ79_04825 [endosymbiont of Lamellibrachia luymesi]RDH92078.1 MAG: hypothetical protein DIZ77_09385 [endosymbiont of Seepiophila jonesi]
MGIEIWFIGLCILIYIGVAVLLIHRVERVKRALSIHAAFTTAAILLLLVFVQAGFSTWFDFLGSLVVIYASSWLFSLLTMSVVAWLMSLSTRDF